LARLLSLSHRAGSKFGSDSPGLAAETEQLCRDAYAEIASPRIRR
jgi:hypothetical protein